ncbi:hypothetical protein C6497_03575 [Candidatus Poribacteria bacterium]|nr:MAG: hypothetical protein C6497_03575 [Candidatus Poribacteria bacterium]
MLILSTFIYVSNTTAENEPYTQWSLPDGAKARLGKGGINDITCTSDGALLAVASKIGIWIYDIQTGEELALLTGHSGSVDRIAFSPDGHTLASGGRDSMLRLWNVDTQTEIGFLVGHTGGPNSIWFSPDGQTLVSRDDDNALRLWDVDTMTQIHILEEYTGTVESVSFSPDGRIFASGGQDSIVRLWDVDSRTEIGTLFGHSGYVSSVSFNPDGNTIATGSYDTTVRLWNVGTRTEIAVLEGHSDKVSSVSFSPDGHTLASGSSDGDLRWWDVGTRTEIVLLEMHPRWVNSVSFSPDGGTIAFNWGFDRYVSYVDLSRPDIIWGGYSVNPKHLWEVYWVVEAIIDAGQSRNIKTILDRHVGHAVVSVSFSSDGKTIAANRTDRPFDVNYAYYTYMWDGATFERIDRLDAFSGDYRRSIESVSFSPDGRTILSRCGQSEICLRDVATNTEIRRLEIPSHWVYIAVFSPDGHTLAIVDAFYDSGIVRLWDVDTDTEIGILWGHIGRVNSVSFSPDGRTLATAGSIDGTVRLWDVDTLTEIATLRGHTGWVNSVSFSPGGKIIVSGSNDGTVRLWDVDTRTEIGTLDGHTDAVNSVSFSPYGTTVASGSSDGTVRIWDVDSQTGMGILDGHTDVVNSVSFSPGGKTVASGSNDGTVLLWNTTSADHGNTLVEATVLILGSSLTAKIDPGNDVDYFRVPIAVRGKLTLWTTGDLDTIGTLQNSEGTTLATNADENGDIVLGFRIEQIVEPGTYYIKVESHEQQIGNYTLYAAFIPTTDVNSDGVVDVLDLMIVAENFGSSETPLTGDVNGDGEVNREDVIAVLDALEAAAAAPSVSTIGSLQRWIDQAKQLNRTDERFQKGIAVLQHLLSTLGETVMVPKATELLANYPNPFNPETWIPYQLAKPVDVTLTIYSVDGAFVRTLALGHQPSGMYHNRSRAAYWDGRNQVGESVASGLYFYTLTAGEFTATRKMLIRK